MLNSCQCPSFLKMLFYRLAFWVLCQSALAKWCRCDKQAPHLGGSQLQRSAVAVTVALLSEPSPSKAQMKKLPPSWTCLLCSQQQEKHKRAIRKSRSPIRHLPGCSAQTLCSHASGQSKSHDQAQCRWIWDASSCHRKAGPPMVMGRMYDSLTERGNELLGMEI